MALINCPECNKEISDKGNNCPHCSFPLVDQSQLMKNSLSNLARTKKPIILFLIVLCIAIFITSMVLINNGKSKANILFKDSITIITSAGNNATNACSIILDVWSNAESRNFNSVFKYMFSGDIQNHEWSGLGMDKQGFSTISWGSTAKEMNSFKERLDNLKIEKVYVDSKLKQIKEIKGNKNEKEIDAIVNYYYSYLKLYDAATNPSGNLLNYSANLVTMKSEFNSNKVKLEMLIK